MSTIQRDVSEFVKEQDIRFIRLAFCDIFGNIKNISISGKELERAFSYGISFDASAIKGFQKTENSDLLLFPVAETMQVLPWRPSSGEGIMLYCDLKNPDGSNYIHDCRKNLLNQVNSYSKKGYEFKIGSESEFYLFKLDEKGLITNEPIDNGGYLDVFPLDRGEDIRREICLTLEEMGFYTERSHHESGPGQMEIDFKYNNVLCSADNLITFRNVVKTIAARNGIYASFLPKPIPRKSGSGLHVNISLKKDDEIGFMDLKHKMVSGIMNRLREISVFSSPHVNSYERLGSHEAPGTVGWGIFNRKQAIRIPEAKGEYSRIEVRTPDASANPYILYSLLCEAVMEGLEDNQIEKNIEENSLLPTSLEEAITIAKNSDFLKKVLPESLINSYLYEKEMEIKECKNSFDYYEKARKLFFEII